MKKYKEIGSMADNKLKAIVASEIRKSYPAIFLLNENEYNIRISDCASYLFSDVASAILSQYNDVDFVISYKYDVRGRYWGFQMRSNNRVNLSDIAKTFPGLNNISSGGGHPNSAGFTIFEEHPNPDIPHNIHDIIKFR